MHRARGARPRGFDGLPSLSDVATVSFRSIIHFWYFCLIWGNKASLALFRQIKQKYQKWIIHRKRRVPTSERESKLTNPRGRAPSARCMEKIYGNLRKPVYAHSARAMHWWQYSTGNEIAESRNSSAWIEIQVLYILHKESRYLMNTADFRNQR